MKSSDLNGISDISDVGDVDMFGLDAFGNPVGLGAAWGVLIGGGLATATSIGLRSMLKSPTVYKWSEGIGFGVGALTGGVMMFFQDMRHSGLAAIATSFATNGLRQVEALFGPSKGFAAYAASKKLLPAVATATATATTAAEQAAAAKQVAAANAANLTALTAALTAGGSTPTPDGGYTTTQQGTDGTFKVITYGPDGYAASTDYYNADGSVGAAPATDTVFLGLGGATRFSRTGVVSGLNGTSVLEPTGVVMGAGHDGLPQLVGASSKSQKVNSATLLGVPGLNSPFSGLAGHFGSSIIG